MKYLNHSASYAVVTNQEILAAPAAGLHHKIHSVAVVVDAASTVKVTEGSDAANKRLIYGTFGANGGQILGPMQFGPYDLAAATALKLSNSAGNCAIVVLYTTE